MRKVFLISAILLITVLISAGVGAVSAKDVAVGTVTGVPIGATVPVNVTIHGADQVDAFGIFVVFNSSVMKVTNSSNTVGGWSIVMPTANQGNITTGG